MIIKNLSNEYFENLGEARPAGPFGLIDKYRFSLALSKLKPGSVLDVGTYFGDFLKEVLLQNPNRQIYGTEINEERKTISNQNIKKNVVRVDFRNGRLSTFENKSVDNIVCTEVIEHVPNHIYAINELCRVAQKRIIITVPLNGKIIYELCIHCNRNTPSSGHLHIFSYRNFNKLIPNEWKIIKKFSFGNKFAQFIAKRLPQNKIGEFLTKKIDLVLSHINPRGNKWLFIIIDRNK